MSFFGFLTSKPKRYLSDEAFQNNLAKQMSMAPKTMMQLRKHGVTDVTVLKLEFFFYTNEAPKAASLTALLSERGYSVKHGRSPHDKSIQVINGWTDKMPMMRWSPETGQVGSLSPNQKYDPANVHETTPA